MIITEKKQLLIGTIIQISFLKTNHSVATINKSKNMYFNLIEDMSNALKDCS